MREIEKVLEELERLEKAATPRPWVYDVGEMLMLPSPSRMHDPKRETGREGWCGEAAGENDGQCMVAARNHLPLLIALARLAVDVKAQIEDGSDYGTFWEEWAARFAALSRPGAVEGEEA